MYFRDTFSGNCELSGIAAFSQPKDTGPVGTSLGAIEAALTLDPTGGYIRGSLARRRLEDAFNSVPNSAAAAVLDELKQKTSPLGKLFRYRLHHATRQAMEQTLERKSNEQKREEADAKLKVKQKCDDLRNVLEEGRRTMKEIESAVEKICRLSGEDSEACLKIRWNRDSTKMKLEDAARNLRLRCP